MRNSTLIVFCILFSGTILFNNIYAQQNDIDSINEFCKINWQNNLFKCLDFSMIIQIFGIIGGISAGFAAISQYAHSVKLRHAEWLHNIYEDFYVEPQLKEIRRMTLKTKGLELIESIVERESSELDEEELEIRMKIIDYYNFFEFVMFLMKTGVLRKKDVKEMFGYYIESISFSTKIKNYLNEYGYDDLYKFVTTEYLNIKQK